MPSSLLQYWLCGLLLQPYMERILFRQSSRSCNEIMHSRAPRTIFIIIIIIIIGKINVCKCKIIKHTELPHGITGIDQSRKCEKCVSFLLFLFQISTLPKFPCENDDLPSVHLILLTFSVFYCCFCLSLLIERIQPIQLK